MDFKKKFKSKLGLTTLELLFCLLIMTLLTTMICLGMRVSNKEFKSTIRNAEARTLASSINSLLNDELSYAKEVRLYTFTDPRATTYLGFDTTDRPTVVVYPSMTQGDLTFVACCQVSANTTNASVTAGRLYFYTGSKESDGTESFDYTNFRINAMVPAKNYSEGCYIKDFKINPVVVTSEDESLSNASFELVSTDTLNSEKMTTKYQVDYFDVSYKICCTDQGREMIIIEENIQVKCLQ